MSELDKYFEKARNVEPIYEEDDARKLLYGKLSDGGIATNLYNKIKVFPMITALITSVATFATIAFFSLSSPEVKLEEPNKSISQKYTSTSSVNSTIDNEKPNEKPEDLNWTEEQQPTSQSNIVQLSEKEQEPNKKPKALNWTEEKIDIKSVNSLKLTKDELAKLGIEIIGKNFKVNAFDKYTYTINQNNEKQRDYYNKDEDHDALPTPAMVTTSTGFKTLTLFKKGNVEATVERYKTSSKKDVELVDHKGFLLEDDWQKRFGDAPQYNMNNQSFAEYKNSLSGHKDSAAIIELMESYEELQVVVNGKKTTIDVQEMLRNAIGDDKELMKKIMQESFVVDNDSSDNLLDFSINVKRNGEYELGESLKLNVDVDRENSNLFYNPKLRDSLQTKNKSLMNNKLLQLMNSSPQGAAIRDLLEENGSIQEAELLTLNVGNTSKMDFSKIELDSAEMSKVYKFESQMKDYIANSKESNTNQKYIPDDLAKALDSILKNNKIEVDPEFQRRLQGNQYMRDLLLRENDDVNVIMLNSNETTENGGKVNVLSDRNVKIYSTDLDLKDINSVLEASLDSLTNKITTLVEVSELDSSSSNDPNNKTIYLPLESLGEGNKIKIMEGIATDINGNVIEMNGKVVGINGRAIDINGKVITEIYEERENSNYKESEAEINSTENKKYEITLDGKTFSIDYDEIIKDGKLDQIKYKEFMLGIGKELGQDINVDSELSGSPSNKIEKYQLNINSDSDIKKYNILGSNFEYNINELIPIEISFDGVNTDFIVWYEATEGFLSKLPSNIKAKINPELMALTEQMDHCENEPIQKKETVMDVWSGCSGAIKDMKVFPNPTTSNSNVEFELQDNRVISIAIFDLSGKLIKNVKTGMSLGKGNTKELLNLTGVNPGLYYVVVKSEKGEQALQRIIIE